MYEHEIPPTSLLILISMFQYTFVWLILKPFDIPCPKNNLYLSGQFSDRCHNINKNFHKVYVKLCHPLEYLNLLWIFKWWHVYYCLFFLKIGGFPSFEIIKPNIVLENTINAHFFGFKMMPYSLHFSKHSLTFWK